MPPFVIGTCAGITGCFGRRSTRNYRLWTPLKLSSLCTRTTTTITTPRGKRAYGRAKKPNGTCNSREDGAIYAIFRTRTVDSRPEGKFEAHGCEEEWFEMQRLVHEPALKIWYSR